ncbi:MAG: nicotinate (nicotinamide) nucleotide adenylyltransferase [Anaerococcus sp.]|uniref:nicotinate (nicotinamide) nucleotide adenylyltransferase n=1 Tax=Anaerococcus sp. TaxID=1872515 RepID=UPI0025B9A0C9|nr:nicotinate (nicotinamide) nucleotide adenylyltransferase [Anaerococcus sp.]MCI5971415.1 nicotinate (nicotinamide) nucleotide adenylyltransferase [Anaerococcus sp.]MDD6919209.1 nicotinate (nicotinamide) nucleotide adenylyltransferase [Peptoniphilaceae bacterium]MDY2928113.1 nicotinate (nicotinamide) nucleotide adenylyltransferase [Anaerococcus sp.]
MRIGLYGGTFDPIHVGHLIVIENAINFMKLDKVIILPSSNPPHKKHKKKTDTNIRVEMVSEAIKDNDKIILSTFESTDDSVRYTHETIRYFKKAFKDDDIFYIMGEDSFLTIDTWKNYDDILDENIIVFTRSNIDKDSELVEKVDLIKKDNPNIFLINNLNINISSTIIRNLVKNKLSIKYLVRDNVRYIIEKRGLYV